MKKTLVKFENTTLDSDMDFLAKTLMEGVAVKVGERQYFIWAKLKQAVGNEPLNTHKQGAPGFLLR